MTTARRMTYPEGRGDALPQPVPVLGVVAVGPLVHGSGEAEIVWGEGNWSAPLRQMLTGSICIVHTLEGDVSARLRTHFCCWLRIAVKEAIVIWMRWFRALWSDEWSGKRGWEMSSNTSSTQREHQAILKARPSSSPLPSFRPDSPSAEIETPNGARRGARGGSANRSDCRRRLLAFSPRPESGGCGDVRTVGI